jgi:hypothetical protein
MSIKRTIWYTRAYLARWMINTAIDIMPDGAFRNDLIRVLHELTAHVYRTVYEYEKPIKERKNS